MLFALTHSELTEGHTEWQIMLLLVAIYAMWMIGHARVRGMRILFFVVSVIIVTWMAIHPYISWLAKY